MEPPRQYIDGSQYIYMNLVLDIDCNMAYTGLPERGCEHPKVVKMKPTIPVTDLQLRLEETLKMLADGPVVLAQHSERVAVLVSVNQWEALTERLEELARFRRTIKMDEAIAAGDFVSHEEFLKMMEE